jgi:hypothetical protein
VNSGATQDRVAYSDENNHVSVSWTASFGIGFNYGPSFVNGQVVCAQWYEGNAKEGIELFVAKDLNSFYSIWLISSSVALFNYTQVVLIDSSYGVEINEMVDKLASAEEGREFSYLRLLTSADEGTCADALAGDSLNCDDDNDSSTQYVLPILIAVLIVVGSLNFFFLIFFGVYRKGARSEKSDDEGNKLVTGEDRKLSSSSPDKSVASRPSSNLSSSGDKSNRRYVEMEE